MSAARLDLHLLGLFRLRHDDQPVAGFDQARLQHLLAYLVLHRHAPILRQQLAFLFWPETTDHQALKNFRTLLTRLRQALPDADHYIAVTAQTIQWRSDASFALDVADFEDALAQATLAQGGDDQARAASMLTAAVAAYTGDLLPDCYEDWILPLRERLHLACGEALERLVVLLEERRDYGDAMQYAQRLLHHDPLHEAAYRHLMHLHLAQGNRVDALRVYHACSAMLKREFGTAPARATRDLFERLPRAEDRPVPAVAGRSPEAQPAPIPLVGRKAEWSRLVSTWRDAAAGRPQIVLLTV